MPPETADSLDDASLRGLVAVLVAQLGEVIAQGKAKDARIDALLGGIKTLTARIAELEAKLGAPPKTPANSSRPPSFGQKANVDAPPPGERKRRKGRPGVARALRPNPDVTCNRHAERCPCGAALPADGQVLAHADDHVDLPPIKPVTTRINLFRAECPCWRKRVTATPPADMPPGSPFGPGIVSILTYRHGCHMVSYCRLVEVRDGLLGVELSEGVIANMLNRAEPPFAAEAGKIADIVRQGPVVASDGAHHREKARPRLGRPCAGLRAFFRVGTPDKTSARVCGKAWWQWRPGNKGSQHNKCCLELAASSSSRASRLRRRSTYCAGYPKRREATGAPGPRAAPRRLVRPCPPRPQRPGPNGALAMGPWSDIVSLSAPPSGPWTGTMIAQHSAPPTNGAPATAPEPAGTRALGLTLLLTSP